MRRSYTAHQHTVLRRDLSCLLGEPCRQDTSSIVLNIRHLLLVNSDENIESRINTDNPSLAMLQRLSDQGIQFLILSYQKDLNDQMLLGH